MLRDGHYKITVTAKDGEEDTEYAEHQLLIAPVRFLLEKQMGPLNVKMVKIINTLTGLPATPEEIEAE